MYVIERQIGEAWETVCEGITEWDDARYVCRCVSICSIEYLHRVYDATLPYDLRLSTAVCYLGGVDVTRREDE